MKMASGKIPPEDLYVLNQRGRGIGRNAFTRTHYKVRTPSSSPSTLSPTTIVSPVAQTMEMVSAKIGIKRKGRKKSGSRTKKGGRGKTKNKKKGKKKAKGKKKTKKTPKRLKKKIQTKYKAAKKTSKKKKKKKK
jgi:hypothetical protein